MTHLARYGRSFAVVAVALASLLVGLPEAEAEKKEKEEFSDTVHVIQNKPVLEQNRFELVPRFGVSINDAISRSYRLGVSANFHFSERAYVGALFDWANFGGSFGGRTRAFEQNFDATSTKADAPVLNWAAAAEGGFKPIYGKFALFNSWIFYYEIGASLGLGYGSPGSLELPQPDNQTVLGTGSINSRLFLNDWLALDLEIRDMLFPAKVSGAGGSAQSTVANIVTLSGGISVYLPTSFDREDDGSQ